jgi:2-C-methyl-D-erythritol 4-phosphate cytidylyltransferase
VRLAGRPLLAHAVEAMEANRCVTAVVVVVHPDTRDACAKLLAEEGFAKVVAVVAGGSTRQASVAAGLAALPPGPAFVAVHDAARPLPGPGAVDRLLELLEAARAAPGGAGPDGVVPGVPVVDTRASAPAVSSTVTSSAPSRPRSCSSARPWRRRTARPASTGSRPPTRPLWSSWQAARSRWWRAATRT